MIKKIDKILIFIISFLIFSNIINYLSHANMASLTTVHLFFLTVAFTFYLAVKKINLSFINIKLNWWILFYLCLILLWFILPHNDYSIEELRRKILSIAALFFFMVFIFYDGEEAKTVRQAVLFTTLLSIFNNIYEFINPYAFFPKYSDIGVFGRSAGFYYNPTISGGAIVLGTIMTITFIKKIYRIWFMLFAFIGVFLTFSRSAIVGFVLVYLAMTIKKQIDVRYMVIIPLVLFLVLSFSFPSLVKFVETTYGGSSSNIINRTLWFLDPVAHQDFSQNERQYVASKAMDMFADHPFFGAGLGSTLHWDARVSTHNIYLTNMAEIGLLGILVYPLLIYAVFRQSKGEAKTVAAVFAMYTLFIGFFSHNILDELYFLFAFALVANLSYKSRIRTGNA